MTSWLELYTKTCETEEKIAAEQAAKVRCVIFDVDGVLTDGGIYIGEKGELYKPFNCKDGLRMTFLVKEGIRTAIITGRESEIVRLRAAKLKVSAVWQGCLDKRKAYQELKEKFSLQDEEIAYIGDDLIDLPLLQQVGFAAAPEDAAEEVKAVCHYVAEAKGGRGAVSEICEYILKAQGKWEKIVNSFLDVPVTDMLAQ